MSESSNDLAESPEPGAEEKRAPRDLRAELQSNLEIQFRLQLEAGTLPDLARTSLISLLKVNGLTSTEILAALALQDKIETETINE